MMHLSTRYPFPRTLFNNLLWVFIAALLAGIVNPAAAQTSGRVILTQPIVDQFPVISFSFDAITAQNRPLDDITPDQLQLLEDGYVMPFELTRVQPGLQVILAFNGGPDLNTSLGTGTLFDAIRQALVGWGQNQSGISPDDFSLSTNTGMDPVREKDLTKWVQALANYQPDLNTSEPDLVALTQALDLATDPNPVQNMKRAILFITPVMDESYLAALPNLADRANDLGVHVYVWLVNADGASNPQLSAPYLDLAQKTDGQLFVFSGKEPLPDPNQYFEPLRSLYQIRYTSGVKTSGDHRLTLSITHPELQANSEPQLFNVSVQAPNPIFLDPPQQILRIWSKPEGVKKTSALGPDVFPIRILIEFPDGFQRPITSTRLYVDGMLMAQNAAAPFDILTWPLSSYEESGSHLLRVEVEDNLGMKQTTIETLVEVMVEPPKRSLVQELVTKERLIILGSLLVTALVLSSVILFASRRTLGEFLRKRRSRLDKDPLTQPVHVRPIGERIRSAAAHIPTIPRSSMSGQSAPARMVRLSESGHPIPSSAILLNQRLFTFGSDPNQASCVLDSPTVEPLHCRLTHTFGGQFAIYDAGSVAGTWVNYDPVTPDGTPLQHGDTIHIGRVAFRFELSIPPAVKPPTVISE